MKRSVMGFLPLLFRSWRWMSLALLLFLLGMSRCHCVEVNADDDGLLLLSFKNGIFQDPRGVLGSWDYSLNATPCRWGGVVCGEDESKGDFLRVTGLVLPESGLRGIVTATLGMIRWLNYVNLSGNFFNGSIPAAFFGASGIEVLDMSDNLISGELPELVGKLRNLRSLNLSGNLLTGNLPGNLTGIPSLQAVALRNNSFSGRIPGGFGSVRVLDLSSNLFNGSLPEDFAGGNLVYLNVSGNRLAGEITPEFAAGMPPDATVDLSFNNLTGAIPRFGALSNQSPASFSGNPGLCGEPLKILCSITSSMVTPQYDAYSPEYSAALPKIANPGPAPSAAFAAAPAGGIERRRRGGNAGTIAAVVVGAAAGIGIAAAFTVYAVGLTRRKAPQSATKVYDSKSSSSSPEERKHIWVWTRWTSIRQQKRDASDEETERKQPSAAEAVDGDGTLKTGTLVTLNGEKELELEALLKSSAYMLASSGSTILYKTVLHDGTTFAVRRIGESATERVRDFENRIRTVAKLEHPNLIRILGFFWGPDEKLVIYEFAPNGTLANARIRKHGLPFRLETRLRIARGVARGLNFIHEKRHVHGNLNPGNILLGPEMEPKIGDLGLDKLVIPEPNSVAGGGSARNFGSNRSTASVDDNFLGGPTPGQSPTQMGLSPYMAPESPRNLKPSPKWDVFSFGVVLLELFTGKVMSSADETAPFSAAGSGIENNRALRMVDAAVRGEIERREEAEDGLILLVEVMKLGFSCVSPLPQKRPAMKEVLQILDEVCEKISLLSNPF